MDQAFDNYSTEFDKGLDQYHKGQLHQLKEDYRTEQSSAINERWNDALDNAPNDESKWATQAGRNQELDSLEKSYDNNFANQPDYLDRRSQLENMQAARSEAISHEIGKVQDNVNTPPDNAPPGNDSPSNNSPSNDGPGNDSPESTQPTNDSPGNVPVDDSPPHDDPPGNDLPSNAPPGNGPSSDQPPSNDPPGNDPPKSELAGGDLRGQGAGLSQTADSQPLSDNSADSQGEHNSQEYQQFLDSYNQAAGLSSPSPDLSMYQNHDMSL